MFKLFRSRAYFYGYKSHNAKLLHFSIRKTVALWLLVFDPNERYHTRLSRPPQILGSPNGCQNVGGLDDEWSCKKVSCKVCCATQVENSNISLVWHIKLKFISKFHSSFGIHQYLHFDNNLDFFDVCSNQYVNFRIQKCNNLELSS